VEDKALRERLGVVRPVADDLDAVRRDLGLSDGGCRGRAAAERESGDERDGESGARQRPSTVRTAKRAAARLWGT